MVELKIQQNIVILFASSFDIDTSVASVSSDVDVKMSNASVGWKIGFRLSCP